MADESGVRPYGSRRSERIERTLADRLAALQKHVRLLEQYAQRAFVDGDDDFLGEVAAKLRLLVIEHGNKPLLLDLMDEMGFESTFTLGGPPVTYRIGDEEPGPGPGDRVTLRQFLEMSAVYRRVPGDGLVSFTRVQLIRAWAQQVGGAHEDRAIDEEFAHALAAIILADRPVVRSAVLALHNTAEVVLIVANRFLETTGTDVGGAKDPDSPS